MHHTNQGFPAGIIRGFAEASGPLVALMDDDDLMLPQRLERQVKEFVKDP